MLANAAIVEAVAATVAELDLPLLVVDPVMVAKGGARLIREEAKKTLVAELIPLAFVLTPNIPEAEVLAGITIRSIGEMKEAARIIHQLGARHVVVKGGHLSGDAVDLLYDGCEFWEFAAPRIVTEDTHGTGCTYSAAIATALAAGKDIAGAVTQAKRYITEAVRHAWRLGGGHGPTNHLAPLFSGGDKATAWPDWVEVGRPGEGVWRIRTR
jgi:hydroxymethylpyrimidine/phosphomethylpyrimidine kinase